MGRQGSWIKRFIDIVLSLLILVITSPILILAILAIRLESPGPAFFLHERTGYKGKRFKLVKFRGMVDNALSVGPELTQVNDPRITRTGWILRRTSIAKYRIFLMY